MAMSCSKCGRATEKPRKVDVPQGVALCGECYAEYTWQCDSCGRAIALPDIEGGEVGHSLLSGVCCCESCSWENTAFCQECGAEDLIREMTANDSGLFCERCSKGDGPSHDHASPLLTRDNWQQVVLEVINEFPEDLRPLLGYEVTSDTAMTIKVACEPILDEEGESCISEVRVTYWSSAREQGWPKEHDSLYGPGGAFEERADWAVISVEGDAEGVSEGIYPDRGSVAMFKQMIQVSLLEQMHSGGGDSIVFKDGKDRFVREDGPRFLPWQ